MGSEKRKPSYALNMGNMYFDFSLKSLKTYIFCPYIIQKKFEKYRVFKKYFLIPQARKQPIC